MDGLRHWFPGKRVDQIAMAKDWLQILSAAKPPWGIPDAEVSELRQLTEVAEELLAMAMSGERTKVVTAECKTAFEELYEKMRFLKGHYFLSPPLVDSDFISLGLTPKDSTRTPVPPPNAQAEADIGRPGPHLLILYLRPLSGSPPDPHRSDYGFRIYWGVMPAGGAAVEAATSSKRELVKIPVNGDELPHSRFTRRKKELFDFPQEDSGKTVYFCVRYENAKGEPGPWGPMFSTFIP
ncbi:MAG: hypothetical protein LBI18_10625 [Planctomycetaceae bacterium]|jgi:hypothetical protein|nr:hypothetical protein [Planctomycetaceae bacterium]